MKLGKRDKKGDKTEGWVDEVAKEVKKIDDPGIASQTVIERYEDRKKTIPPDEMAELASKMTEKLVKTQEIENEVAEEFVRMLLSDDDVSNQDIMEPVKQVLSARQNFGIVSTADIPEEDKHEIVQSMEDEELRKKAEEQLRKAEKKKKDNQIKRRLKEIYSTSDTKEATELIGELKAIKSQNPEINKMIARCIARKAAMELRIAGTTRIATLTEVISAKQMLEGDFLHLVAEEFEGIKKEEEKFTKNREKGETDTNSEEYEKKRYEYSEEGLEQQILVKLAEEVARKYEKMGIIDIPQSGRMKKLAQGQQQFFIEQIIRCSNSEIKVKQIEDRMKGSEDHTLEDLQEIVKKIPESQREDYLIMLTRQIERGKISQLDPKVEDEIEKLKRKLQDLEPEDAIKILQEKTSEREERKEKGER